MLGLWSLGSAPLGLSLHIAFAASLDDVLGACGAPALARRHAAVVPRRGDDEPSVIGWMPAAAVYFRDPDGHLLEYLAMLDEPARPELGIVPWSQWTGRGPVTIRAARLDDLTPTRGDRARCGRDVPAARRRTCSRATTPAWSRTLTPYAEGEQCLRLGRRRRHTGRLLLLDVVDGAAHIEQVSVHPDHARQGLGRALIEHASSWARSRDLHSLTLTTYVDVPWNGPVLRTPGLQLPGRSPGDTGASRHPRARARARSRGMAARLHAPRPRLRRSRSAGAQRALSGEGAEARKGPTSLGSFTTLKRKGRRP